MARPKKRRTHKKAAPPPAQEPFPFMSLPPEIRLMAYDAAMPLKEIHLNSGKGSLGLPPTIRALMEVKVIREELIPHLYGRYHFVWTDGLGRGSYPPDHHWDRFKRHVVPYISSLSFKFAGTVSLPSSHSSYDSLDRFLRWTRWRSLRPHLHPWHLKSLTLVKAFSAFDHLLGSFVTADDLSRGADRFLTEAPVVPGLDSLNFVLNARASEEAVKEFLERCVSCEIVGRIGYCPYGQEKVVEWFCLQDNQVVSRPG